MIVSFCYDASTCSRTALDFVAALHSRQFFEKLFVCYIYDRCKTYLPPKYQAQYIEDSLAQKFAQSVDVERYIKPIQEGKNLSEEMLLAQYHHKCNLMILGYYGRKGQKNHPEEVTPKIRKFVYESKIPLLIIKQNRTSPNSPIRICYTYDGSNTSDQSLANLIIKITDRKVKLTVVYVGSKDESKQPLIVRNTLREFKNSNKQRVQIDSKIIENSASPRVDLVDYLNESRPDIVVVTRNGCRGQITGKTFVGETMTAILIRVKTNIWIIK